MLRDGRNRRRLVLIREWHGVSHRVTMLDDGVSLRGVRYCSLLQPSDLLWS